jgi:general secretion pathway protein K
VIRLRASEPERGIAIVAALWAAAILAVIVLSVLQIVRADARVGRSREDVTELNGVADAAVNITILSMLGPQTTQPPVNAVPFTLPFAGRAVLVTVQDEAGKIDLNMTSDATLRQLLLVAGLDTGSATEVANSIIARRGTGAGGPSNSGNTADGLNQGPLQSVEELQLITGMTQELYHRVAPLVTVYSQIPWIDPAFSSPQVLNVFRTIDPNAEAAWRRLEDERTGLRPPTPSPGVTRGHAFTITAEVNGAASARVIRTAVIRLTGQSQAPLLVYRWN